MFPIRHRNHLIFIVLAVAGIGGFGGRLRQAVVAAPVDPRSDVKNAEPMPFPDGVTDPELHTGFVSSPRGGIQEIRLEDGKVLWSNDDCAAKPWLVAGQRLIARGERIVLLDLKDGKVVRQCEPLSYPTVEIPDRCTVSFNLWAPHVSGDTLEARWYAAAYIDRRKGRPFAFQAWTAFNKVAPVGTVKVNLTTGRSEVQHDEKPADVTGTLMPQEARPEQRIPAGLAAKLTPVWQQYHHEQNGRIALVDSRLIGVAMIVEPLWTEYTKKVVLNSWDPKSGEAGKPEELIKDKALSIANIVLTEDRRHAGVQFSTSALTLFSLADGKVVAREVKGVLSPENAYVAGKHLYHVRQTGRGGERTLEAIDLKSGTRAWEQTLEPRSTTPLPP
jgi:hypothetical protein